MSVGQSPKSHGDEMLICIQNQKRFQTCLNEVLAKNERLKQELKTTTKAIKEETPLLKAVKEKEPWLQEFCQKPSTTVLKSIAYDKCMKDQVITEKIGQRIPKVIDDYKKMGRHDRDIQ